jgi:hypothetical protein
MRIRQFSSWLAGITLLSLSSLVLARDYQIEVALFENVVPQNSILPGDLYFPKVVSAIGLNSAQAANAGFELVDQDLTLSANVEKIIQSRRYRLLRHFAWRQPGLDTKSAQAVRINLGDTMTMYLPEDTEPFDEFIPASAQTEPERVREVNTTEVNGTLKVRLGRFLHLDTRLVFTDTENLHSYRLSQSRKMRSRELHYIDNERFGLLVRILPVEQPPVEPAEEPAEQPAEEPASPADAAPAEQSAPETDG